MGNLWQKITSIPNLVYGIVGAVIVLGSITGGAFFMEDRYANAEQTVKSMQMLQMSIQKTNTKIDMHAMQQRINALDEQLWRIENRCHTRDVMAMPEAERDRYRRLKKQRDALERKLAIAEAAMKTQPAAPTVPEGNSK
jgi:hypothetical protein